MDELIEKVMTAACECCHWPYACNEEELTQHCMVCPVEAAVTEWKEANNG